MEEEIIQPIDKALLKSELTPDKQLRMTNKSHNEIYISKSFFRIRRCKELYIRGFLSYYYHQRRQSYPFCFTEKTGRYPSFDYHLWCYNRTFPVWLHGSDIWSAFIVRLYPLRRSVQKRVPRQ